MENYVYYNELYDLYKDLLTEKQRQYFEDYYFSNLSFSEMADNYNVSRNAVFKQIHIVTNKLEEYESILQLLKKKNELIKIINSLDDEEIKKRIEKII